MSKTTMYNKLVRSKIPNIIKANKKIPNFEHKPYLDLSIPDLVRAKLREEFSELMSAKSSDNIIEEAADLIEILETYLILNDYNMKDVEIVREAKFISKGPFLDNGRYTYLIDVEEKA